MFSELLNNLAEAINAADKKSIKKYVAALNRCGCDRYSIYILLSDPQRYKINLSKQQLYNLIQSN